MWSKIYNQLNSYHKSLSIKDYCHAFIKLINKNDELWTLDELEKHLSKNDTSELFPETKNLHSYFNSGDYKFVINYIYHFPKTDKYWFDTDNKWDNVVDSLQYKKIFDQNSDVYIFKKSIFMPEFLLSENNLNRQLTFLFLFFLPIMENYEMLYHHKKKIPLLCCHGITNENFNMLLHFMREYDLFGINSLSGDRNLNHILIEEFMENSSELYSFDPETKWDEVLPLYKIHKLFEVNCNFKMFAQKMSKKFKYTFENMPEILMGVERRYLYINMTEQLSKKEYVREKILKV